MPDGYRYRLLRLAPNVLSGECYNVAVLLYDLEGRLLEGRFAPDFARLRSNPLADLEYLGHLRDEFEERRLAEEGFSAYVEDLTRNLSMGLQLTDDRFLMGEDTKAEADRLSQVLLATNTPSLEIPPAEPARDSRAWVRLQMRQTFRAFHLLERLREEVDVGHYVHPGFRFPLDFATRPNGAMRYFHAVSLQRHVAEAFRLASVFDRIRAIDDSARLTAVLADEAPADTLKLLESSAIEPWRVSHLTDLALAVREEMGLQ